MTNKWVSGLGVVLALSLSACVMPQRPAAPMVNAGAVPNTVAPNKANPAPAVSPYPAKPEVALVASSSPKVQASKKYQQQLETQLMCPAKSLLAVNAMRKATLSEGIVGRPGKTESYEPEIYPVTGDLSVFGFKVIALEITGNDNAEGASVQVHIQASLAEMTKLFKSQKINLKKLSGHPNAYSAHRPLGQNTGYFKEGNLIKLGCSIPID